jgi:hypothetical protein
MADELLARLFPGQAFLDHFPDEVIVGTGPIDRIAELVSDELLADPERLIRAAHGEVCAATRTREGHSHLISVPPAVGACLWANGTPIEIPHIDRVCPAVARWQKEIDRELGYERAVAIRCSAFVSRGGAHSGMHFDRTEVLNLQLRGTKRWLLAPNTDVAYAMHPFLAGLKDGRGPRHDAGYFPPRFHVPEPASCRVVDMTPGTAMLIPRGHWHRVEADDASVSIGFVLETPTAIEALLAALRHRLIGRADARRPLRPDRAAARREVAQLAGRAAEALARAGAEAAADAVPVVRRGALVLGEIGSTALACEVVAILPGDDPLPIKIDRSTLPLMTWIGEREAPFTAGDASRANPALEPALVQRLIGALVDARVLIPCPREDELQP